MSNKTIVKEYLVKSFENDLKIINKDILEENITGDYIIDFSNSEYNFVIYITDTNSIGEILDKKVEYNNTNFILASLSIINSDFRKECHKNDIITFIIDDIQHHTYIISLISYIYNINNEKFSFIDVINTYEDETKIYKDHIESSCGTILKRYLDINLALQIWEDKEIENCQLEYSIISAVLKPEQSIYHSIPNQKGKTFSPMMTWVNNNGEEVFFPDLMQLNNSENQSYIFDRVNSTKSNLLKYRYLELFLFWNTKLIEKPSLIKMILNSLDNLIKSESHNKDCFKYIEQRHLLFYQRKIELINNYYSMFDESEINFQKKSYNEFFINTCDNNIRWALEIIKNILNYKRIAEQFFHDEQNKTISFKYISQAKEHFKNENNFHLMREFIKLENNLNSYLNTYNSNEYIEQIVESHFLEYEVSIANNNYLAATIAIENAINTYSSNKSKYKNKIDELKKLYKKTAKKNKDDMKSTEISLPDEQVKLLIQSWDDDIERINDAELDNALSYFFSNFNYFMSKELFEENLRKTDDSISSLFPIHILDEDRTVIKSTNEEEQNEIRYWDWYGKLVILSFKGINYRISKLINTKFTKESIITYIENKSNINDDDKTFLIRSLDNYFLKNYCEFNSIAIPLLERFFRNITHDELSFTKTTVNFQTNLDMLIEKSIEYNFPENISIMSRYLLTQKAGLNLRNYFAHGKLNFEIINNEYYSNIILWLLLFCYFGLKDEN